MKKLIPLLASLLLLTACAGSIVKPLDPEVSFAGLSLKSASLFSQTFEVMLNVDNPNRFAATIDYLDYELYLNDVKIGSGSQQEDYTLTAKDRSQVPLAFSTNIVSLLSMLNKVKDNKGHYRVKGQVKVKNWPSVRYFDRKGEIDLNKVMAQVTGK